MSTKEQHQFNLLKNAVVAKFLEHHSVPSDVKNWNGDDILRFQEDLFTKVKARVSEKWFYTYFKKDHSKLPRIDMLNLLSRYVGQENWHAFRNDHPKIKTPRRNKKIAWFAAALPLFVVFFTQINSKNEFQFCFIDDLNENGITSIPIDIKILFNDQSPIYLKTDSLGCFNYSIKEDHIKFVVTSPYHKTDTIVRSIDANKNTVVKLDSDNYALMLKYYTNGNVTDWTKHKKNLEQLFHDDVKIYRLYDNQIGIEKYSKEDFIRLLTIPTKTLKQIKILDKHYEQHKIKSLKFTVK